MGHLEVAVITEKKPTPKLIAECMEPFYQDLEVNPYVCAEYPEVKKRLRKYSDLLSGQEKRELFEALDKDDIGTIRYYNMKIQYFEDVDKDGNAISTSNPNTKWDYYTITKGCGMYDQPKDYIQVKEVLHIDLKTPEDGLKREVKLREQFHLIWQRWMRHKDYSIVTKTFAEYLCIWMPWAVLTPDGEWIERDKETDVQWNDKYNGILDNLPGDYYLTSVNIHM